MKRKLFICLLLSLLISNTYAINVCNIKEYPNSIDYRYAPITDTMLYIDIDVEGKLFIYKDGEKLNELLYKPDSPYFNWNMEIAPDGISYAYLLLDENGKSFMIHNGVEGKKYDFINDPIFSSKNELMYIAGNGVSYAEDYEVFLVYNGIEGKKYKDIRMPIFSPDGENVVYSAKTDNNKWVIVENGIEIEDDLEYNVFVRYSKDNKLYYINSKGNGKQYISSKDKVIIEAGGLLWADGRSWNDNYDVRYFFEKEKGLYILMEGTQIIYEIQVPEGYRVIREISISNDLEHLAYSVWSEDRKKIAVIKDGEIFRVHNGVSHLLLSPDGKRLVYYASNMEGAEDYLFVLDGKEIKTSYPYYTFSPDSKKLAYSIRDLENKKISFMINDSEIEKRDWDGFYEYDFLPNYDLMYTYEYSIYDPNLDLNIKRLSPKILSCVNHAIVSENIEDDYNLRKQKIIEKYSKEYFQNIENKLISSNINKTNAYALDKKFHQYFMDSKIYNKNKELIELLELYIKMYLH